MIDLFTWLPPNYGTSGHLFRNPSSVNTFVSEGVSSAFPSNLFSMLLLVELALTERDYKNAGVSIFYFFCRWEPGGVGYFLIRGLGCASGWGRIFTTGLTIMGSHFQ